MDTITYRFEGRNHYVLTAIDLNTRVAYTKPLITKHTKYTARALLEIIENVERLRAKALSSSTNNNSKIPITILSDNGSEFHKEFEALIVEKRLEHLWTYPRSPKQNAHNQRFNRTIQEIRKNQTIVGIMPEMILVFLDDLLNAINNPMMKRFQDIKMEFGRD